MADDALTLEDLPVAERKALSPSNPLVIDYAQRTGAAAGLPANLLPAIIVAGENSGPKSGPNKDGVSPKGARGLAQLMPATAKELGIADPEDPVQGIAGGARYLANASAQHKTADPALLAASYNAGANHPAIARGQIPRIPETQAFTKRVTDYMGAQPQAAAAAPAPALTAELGWEDLPEDGRAAMRKSGAAPDPSTGGGTLQFGPWDTGIKTSQGVDRALTGVGKQFVDAVRGTGQLAVDAVINPLSRAATGKDLVQGLDAAEAERARLDAPVMDTGAGMAGYGLGAAATTFVPGGVLARGAGPALRAVPLVGRAAAPVLDAAGALRGPVGAAVQAAGPQAVAGAGLGLTQPVTAPGERTTNALVSGAVGGGLGAAGSALAASPVGSAARALYDKVAGAAGGVLFKPSILGGAAPTERAALAQAAESGVPMYGSQLAEPGAAQPAMRAADQLRQFSRAVTRSFGEDGEDIAAAFPAARERLSGPGGTYETLLNNKTAPLDTDFKNGVVAASTYNSAREPLQATNRALQDMIDRAYATATQKGQISGKEYQEVMRDYKALQHKFVNGTPENPSDPYAAQGVNMLMGIFEQAMSKGLTPEELAAFKLANRQWRNLTQLESLAPKTTDGDISPKALATKLARMRKGEFVYGQGDQTLPNLARFGNTYMGLGAPPQGGFMGQAKGFAKQWWPFLALDVGGGAAGAALGTQATAQAEANPEEHLLGKLAPYAGGVAGALAVHSLGRRVFDPRLAVEALHSPRGALGEWFSRTQPGPAVGLTVDAARDKQP